jgi:LysM repeat protein
LPTESAVDFTISVLFPAPNREFTAQETINFDWYWPTLPQPGVHFAVYLIDGEREFQLGVLNEPNNGGNYRLAVPGEDLPVTGEALTWQIRMESIDGSDVVVASDLIPITIRADEPTAGPTGEATATDTTTPTTAACVVDPPSNWVLYTIRLGDALAGLAQRANIPVEALMEVNCLPNDLISVGQQIWVPPAALPPTPTPVLPTNTPPPPPRPTATTSGITPEPPPPSVTPDTPTDTPPTEEPTFTPPPDPTEPPT